MHVHGVTSSLKHFQSFRENDLEKDLSDSCFIHRKGKKAHAREILSGNRIFTKHNRNILKINFS